MVFPPPKAAQEPAKEAAQETDLPKQNIEVSTYIEDIASSEPPNEEKDQSAKDDTLEVSKGADLEASKSTNIEANLETSLQSSHGTSPSKEVNEEHSSPKTANSVVAEVHKELHNIIFSTNVLELLKHGQDPAIMFQSIQSKLQLHKDFFTPDKSTEIEHVIQLVNEISGSFRQLGML